jgi:hypothetical protein
MKQYYLIAAFFLLAAFLFSCKQNTKQKENNTENTTSITQAVEKKPISIELKGILRTRRSYSNVQYMDDEKEMYIYLAKQKRSNPELYTGLSKEDSILINQFVRLGLIKRGELLLRAFKKQTKQVDGFTDVSGQKMIIKFYNDDSSHTHFKVFCNMDSTDVNTGAISLQNLDYAFLDIIPGGNKELVFLDDYYVMNGDNFDFKVYEIKTN